MGECVNVGAHAEKIYSPSLSWKPPVITSEKTTYWWAFKVITSLPPQSGIILYCSFLTYTWTYFKVKVTEEQCVCLETTYRFFISFVTHCKLGKLVANTLSHLFYIWTGWGRFMYFCNGKAQSDLMFCTLASHYYFPRFYCCITSYNKFNFYYCEIDENDNAAMSLCTYAQFSLLSKVRGNPSSQNAFILLDQHELKYGLFARAVAHILNFFLPLKYA